MEREPFKMTDAGSRPEPRRFPVRLVVAIYLAACAILVLGVVMYAASKGPSNNPDDERGVPPRPSSRPRPVPPA